MAEPEALVGLPRLPVASFVGREQALSALREALATGPGVISQAIVGLGGVGKSELALQYAHRHRADYRLVWWMEAESPAHVQAGLAGLTRAMVAGVDSVAAEQATTEEAAAWALAWLGTRTGWLVVFDNVEEVADVEPHLAWLARGHVLITTRRDIGWPQRGITPLRLEVLDRPASITLLAGLIGSLAADRRPVLNELANRLGDLPLALAQAGAYIARTPGITPARYLRLLSDTPARMHAAAPAGGDAARVVAKVWTLSHARLRAIDPLTVRVLNVLSCYAPDDLPVTVLTGFDDADDVAVSEALALLASYSLITVTTSPALGLGRAPEDLVSVHRLVQAVTLDQLTPDQRERWRAVAAGLLQDAVPADPQSRADWPLFARLLPHARVALPASSPALQRMLSYLGSRADHHTAKELSRHIHDTLAASRGAEHPSTLAARHELAGWTGLTWDTAAARDEFAALLPIRERVLGAEHPDTLITRSYLANYTGLAGDAAAAREQCAALLAIYARLHGVDHPLTLDARHDMAHWTGEEGDPVTARDQLAALLPIRERLHGAEDPRTLLVRHVLARWTGAAGDPAAARDQLAALLPIRERVLGADNLNTLITRHDLAVWTGEAGAPAAARDQLAALLPLRERVLGAEDPYTLATRRELARWTQLAR
ncbi:FxSxx-COOH system tetratricopeptide repeat protein [Nonomuraea zeae]|nr:FxSxx-COOH system tetratricopeptide repeat protein [Nonomuraea zeae]